MCHAQSPSERLKLSQILCHPFMTGQSYPQETRLRHGSTRGFVPSVLGSLDSGHATMSSSNRTLSHHGDGGGGGGGGPLRATLRPKGLPPRPAPPPQGSETSIRNTAKDASTSSGPFRSEQQPLKEERHNGFLCRRANSLGALNGQDSSGRQDDTWSYHSQPVERRKSYSCQNGDKENHPVPKVDVVVGDGQGRATRRPFQDKTNRQALNPAVMVAPSKPKVPSSSKPLSRVGKQQKVGSLKDLVPPLNAARLHPTQHETRTEVVSFERFLISTFILLCTSMPIYANSSSASPKTARCALNRKQ